MEGERSNDTKHYSAAARYGSWTKVTEPNSFQYQYLKIALQIFWPNIVSIKITKNATKKSNRKDGTGLDTSEKQNLKGYKKLEDKKQHEGT